MKTRKISTTSTASVAAVANSSAPAGRCATYHASDADYASKIWYWTTPTAQCLDGRTNVTCKDYAAWAQAWTSIKG